LDLGALALGDVVKAVDCPRDVSALVLQGADVHDDRDARAVGPLDEHLGVDHLRQSSAHDLGHGTLLVGHEAAVRTEHLE
jgi:hypothetical protein